MFNRGATLQQCSDLFYQKLVKIESEITTISVGGCGEEKGSRLTQPTHPRMLKRYSLKFLKNDKIKT